MGAMKLITEPKVYLVGRPQVDYSEVDEFLADEGTPNWSTDAPTAAERLVEIAGRLCYSSFTRPRPGGNKAYIGHLLECQHGSVLEHAVFSLIVTGISRACSHELIRHRHLSPSMLSQRYVDSSDVAFVVPPALLGEVGNAAEAWRPGDFGPDSAAAGRGLDWLVTMKAALDAYSRLADYLFERSDLADKTARRKAAREAARSVLPNAAETKMFLTGNARAWRAFIELRASPHADAEIRRLALAVHQVLRDEAPNIFGDYEEKTDGQVTWLETSHRKV